MLNRNIKKATERNSLSGKQWSDPIYREPLARKRSDAFKKTDS